MRRVYFDHNATSSLLPAAREAMLPWIGEMHGNPSSIHREGQQARGAIEAARDDVAALIGADRLEIVWTASGTEANNMVLADVGQRYGHRGHLVLSSFEHPSIARAVDRLEMLGMRVTRVPPGEDGVVSTKAFVQAFEEDTRWAELMLANNELGTLQPVAAVGAECRERGIAFHCDAVQAVGKVPVDCQALGVDSLVVGAHKFHGPVGAAALWLRSGSEVASFLVGGSQERQRRAGTENVPAIVGFGMAARTARLELEARGRSLADLRDRFEAGLAKIPEARIHCAKASRLPNTSHVAFPGIEGEALLIRLDLAGFAVSTGSACSAGTVEPSKTLLAIGLSPAEALASVRVSFGVTNTVDEVDEFLAVLEREVASLRSFATVEVAS